MTDGFAAFACITPKPEHYDEARAAIIGIVDQTRTESGCQMFVLYEARPIDGSLYLYEIWENDAALAAHHEQAYTKRVFDAYRQWLARPVEIKKLTTII